MKCDCTDHWRICSNSLDWVKGWPSGGMEQKLCLELYKRGRKPQNSSEGHDSPFYFFVLYVFDLLADYEGSRDPPFLLLQDEYVDCPSLSVDVRLLWSAHRALPSLDTKSATFDYLTTLWLFDMLPETVTSVDLTGTDEDS